MAIRRNIIVGDTVIDEATQRTLRVVAKMETGWLVAADARGQLHDLGPHRKLRKTKPSGVVLVGRVKGTGT